MNANVESKEAKTTAGVSNRADSYSLIEIDEMVRRPRRKKGADESGKASRKFSGNKAELDAPPRTSKSNTRNEEASTTFSQTYPGRGMSEKFPSKESVASRNTGKGYKISKEIRKRTAVRSEMKSKVHYESSGDKKRGHSRHQDATGTSKINTKITPQSKTSIISEELDENRQRSAVLHHAQTGEETDRSRHRSEVYDSHRGYELPKSVSEFEQRTGQKLHQRELSKKDLDSTWKDHYDHPLAGPDEYELPQRGSEFEQRTGQMLRQRELSKKDLDSTWKGHYAHPGSNEYELPQRGSEFEQRRGQMLRQRELSKKDLDSTWKGHYAHPLEGSDEKKLREKTTRCQILKCSCSCSNCSLLFRYAEQKNGRFHDFAEDEGIEALHKTEVIRFKKKCHSPTKNHDTLRRSSVVEDPGGNVIASAFFELFVAFWRFLKSILNLGVAIVMVLFMWCFPAYAPRRRLTDCEQ